MAPGMFKDLKEISELELQPRRPQREGQGPGFRWIGLVLQRRATSSPAIEAHYVA